jgi:hypothetical protein
MRADGQTRQTLIVAFRCFSNVPHKYVLLKAIRYAQRNRDSVVGIVTRPRVRWSGVRIPEGAKVSRFLQDHPYEIWGLPSLLFSVYRGSFPGVKWGAKLTIRLHLEPKLRKCAAIPTYSPYDSMQWTGTISIPFTYIAYCSITLPDIPIGTFCGFASVSTVQYLQESIQTNHCLLRIHVRFSPSQRVTFYEVLGSSPRCSRRFLTFDSPRY